MPGPEILVAFFMATAVFAFMPGPALLYAAAQTIARGRRAGLLAALGLHLGGYVHVFAAALGLAVVFAAVPMLYVALKIAGAAYLIWLGINLFLSRPDASERAKDTNRRTGRHAFWQSVTVEALNPKTALFFVAFLPQFTDPAASLPIWSQLLVLGIIVNVTFSTADLVCVFLADKVAGFVQARRSATRLMQRIGGSMLVALGLNLALNRN